MQNIKEEIIWSRPKKTSLEPTELRATLKTHSDGTQQIVIKEITPIGWRLPYCPTGYPCVIFIRGKSKTAYRKALDLANAVASLNI